ncbi:hypothetical protein CcaverHIS002_0405190 [Cutaneotrichosporon cavernicola]|uniref:FUN34 transmembrane protein n=1 Tax=Cutaneotrichosporon cavernicola TaxID=279322 RepID=A0AA48QVT9_9TREE|nr:uncharacterized protein CcaverHIS019_0405150 [Cutaneotrichosporon cavernicola]BEI83915.1 hypothetical protein CcaverHIS002_0405190 [Cutaneotrichosporon cavernicola]BEI91695.1 hypothetical protein CcaverHIS019_0405150 [Cutaneotrichosporon cavernicola]BEI99470.1 hypothetical protein CcaverHIS631_0405130 [Cutaneotrichosporon cavernicola]BEJ07248.1 hypothetical protein CcaverHIS641_0405170 [Cutaneotrichosporon cavernicola]
MSDANGNQKNELNNETGNVDANFSGGTGVSRFITPGGNPMDTSQPAFPVFHRKFANPAPLGLLAFGGTTLVLSLFNAQARDVTHPNVILGLALGYGGFAQVIAGVEEWACGNTFGATAFTSYGAFWLSFSVFYIPQLEVMSAYPTQYERDSALGIYLTMWGIITFIFLLGTLRSSVALFLVFFFLVITFFVLAAGHFTGHLTTTKAGGGLGVVTALCAFYTALAGILTKDTSYFLLPVGDLSK